MEWHGTHNGGCLNGSSCLQSAGCKLIFPEFYHQVIATRIYYFGIRIYCLFWKSRVQFCFVEVRQYTRTLVKVYTLVN
ncbi:hypothetical protein OIU79_024571 [Salix purpurea]|uniref:Uncharacterized protein n=1 Tax=Salix purpurea TaxID=77065 RepID=A0A9Q1AAN0_SALPP|nr:hypothetical protein OIU79_024571 [Salix purpurea]